MEYESSVWKEPLTTNTAAHTPWARIDQPQLSRQLYQRV